ncbi:MAG: agarase, partial [Planctomycetota bacterium]
DRFPTEQFDALYEQVKVPILVGEWHFGALDAGLPGGSLRRVATQQDRAEAYRVYAEAALAHPACVGIHWFTLYDEAAAGRFDGENWNIGFLDVCHRPYDELAAAARTTHERMYAVAAGEIAPYEASPDYRRMNVL